ncbi:DUF6190 family protein [Streptomyces sp. NPDC102360]|uniref:DUF6190 family protein n=1 Tax=Streptomyces sp. NPDC102360 TaxID=3366160 RepID=UPI0037F60776
MPADSTDSAAEAYVDASLFMGMHAVDQDVRRACASFFATHLRDRVWMTYEEVGRCDDVVWALPRATQDAYYPFMDVLHSTMPVKRTPYAEDAWKTSLDVPGSAGLSLRERLLLATVVNSGSQLVTVNPRLLALAGHGMPVVAPGTQRVTAFPQPLAALYRTSHRLELDHARV